MEKLQSLIYIIYVYVLIVVKVYYIVTLMIIRIMKSTNSILVESNTISKNVVLGMLAALMIYLFHPIRRGYVLIQGETKVLMFLFGILGLLDLPWDIPFQKLQLNTKLSLTQQQFSLLLGSIITAILSLIVVFV